MQSLIEERQARQMTPQQFLASLEAQDLTIAAWAREHKQPANTVYMLCLGRLSGARGKARVVAKAMGLAVPAMHEKAGQ